MTPVNPADSLAAKHLDTIQDTLRRYKKELPPQRQPTIIVAGKTGSGKSTTINFIFAKDVSKVGLYGRGTNHAEPFEWMCEDENVRIVDLPGLGDTPQRDAEYIQMYKHWAEKADAFVIVAIPPRPGEFGTIKATEVLIEAGVPSKDIIFALNRVSLVSCRNDDGRIEGVKLDSVLGMIDPDHAKAVEMQRQAFLEDIRASFPKHEFLNDQVVPYDALTGWNLYPMLTSVINRMSYQTLAAIRKAMDEAERRYQEKVKEAEARVRKMAREAEEARARAAATDKELNAAERKLSHQDEELSRANRALDTIRTQQREFESSFVGRVTNSIASCVESYSPSAAQAVRSAGQALHSAGQAFKRLLGF